MTDQTGWSVRLEPLQYVFSAIGRGLRKDASSAAQPFDPKIIEAS